MKLFQPLIFAFLFISILVSAQSTRLNRYSTYDQTAERLLGIYSDGEGYFSSVQPFPAKRAIDILYPKMKEMTASDRQDFINLVNQYDFLWKEDDPGQRGGTLKFIDSSQTFYTLEQVDDPPIIKKQKPFLKHFYANPHHLLSLDRSDFHLRLNPVIDFALGNKIENNRIFQNTRGVLIDGIIDGKVYFHSSIFENQASFLPYVVDKINEQRSIPGNGLYKSYESAIVEKITGYDYLNARAYVGLNVSKSINIEFGHGQNFLGDGIRSLLLSDYANNYLYLKFNTQIWKLHYQNIFGELAAVSANRRIGDVLIPKKYFANHYLAFHASKRLEIGLFETVVFSRPDHFDFQYLNPIIFYRTVEQFIGSPDNVLVGLNASYQFRHNVKMYGQFILDEFKLSNIGDQWWANKYGIQLGLKQYNFAGIDRLDVGAEFNQARPFIYSHHTQISEAYDPLSVSNYSHYGQELAHPLGANFREVAITLDYAIGRRWSIHGSGFYMLKGENLEGENLGSNIFESNSTRERDFGNEMLQGDLSKRVLLRGNLNYALFTNGWFSLDGIYRKNSGEPSSLYIGGSLKINVQRQNFDF